MTTSSGGAKMMRAVGEGGESWFSMEGFLSMKQLNSALSFLTSRKRLYFGLDEAANRLVYFKDKSDFDRRKDGQEIPLDGAICIPTTNIRVFILHTATKKLEIEADNPKCAECWIVALQRRKDINDNQQIELPALINNMMKRYRSRSRSMPSDAERSPPAPTARPKNLPTRRKTMKIDGLKRLTLPPPNQSCPVTPMAGGPFSFPTVESGGHASRLSRCISLNAARSPRASNGGQPRVVVDPNKRRASLQTENIAKHCGSAENVTGGQPDEKPPTWLEDWVSKWLDEQMKWSNEQKAVGTTERHEETPDSPLSRDAPDRFSPAETTSLNDRPSSATTSRCGESDDHSSLHSATSEPEICEELLLLREIDNQQKARIHSLTLQIEKMKEVLQSRGKPIDEPALLEQNRLLNSEVVRMSEQCLGLDKQLQSWTKKCETLENELENVKKEYVFLLQSSVRIPLHDHFSCDTVQVKLFGGDVHERRVKKLLAAARQLDPKLPTFESVTKPGSYHVDDYGFRHSFDEIPLALHYISTQLNAHYFAQSNEYVRLKGKWRAVLEATPNRIENNKANRALCRAGIPRSMRSAVWRVLINQQTADLKKKHGEYFFRSLCSTQATPNEKQYCATHQKQINLDLLRTMPSNVHFLTASCKGTVLRAFCLYNPTIGYSQGMNFLAATALLFVSPEDAFWFLVAITERYFDPSYFDENLTGAQADQEVLKEILEMKFPKLAKHLEECDIEITTISLNWFLALFFDAVPFQSMLRIWDCFLLEGPKVLFRFSVALLGLYQDEILQRSDTNRRHEGAESGRSYAFDELQFPNRHTLRQKQLGYLEVLRERLSQRRALRNILDVIPSSPQSTSDRTCDLPIEAIVFNEFNPGVGFVCVGNQKRGKLAMIHCHPEATNLQTLELEFDCRPVSMVVLKKDMAFLSLLSNYIVALRLGEDEAEILWELKLADVALKLLFHEERLRPTSLDLYNIPVSAAPITDGLVDEEFLYLSVASKVMVLNKESLSPVASIYVASSACGSHIPMFEKIRALAHSPHGIFVVTAHSSLVQLWREADCQMLYDIGFDHSRSSRRPSIDEDSADGPEIFSILYHEDDVFIGTVDGFLMLYRVEEAVRRSSFSTNPSQTQGSNTRYPAGKRLSPVQTNSEEQHGSRQAMVSDEKRVVCERRLLFAVLHSRHAEKRCWRRSRVLASIRRTLRQTRKISVVINPQTKEYRVNVEPVRQFSQESAGQTAEERARRASSSAADSSVSAASPSREGRAVGFATLPPTAAAELRAFSGDSHHSPRLQPPPTVCQPIPETPGFAEKWRNKRRHHSDSAHLADMTGVSLEYDDTFDLDDCDGEVELQLAREIGLLEESLGHNSPTVLSAAARCAQIPARRMSASVFGKSRRLTVDEEDEEEMNPDATGSSRTQSLAASDSSAEENRTARTSRRGSQRANPLRLRRKDLEIETNATLLRRRLDPHAARLLRPPTPPPPRRRSATSSPPAAALAPTANAEERRERWLSYTSSRKPSMIADGVEKPLEEKAMKLKVSDRPLKCIALTQFNGEPVVITGAGAYGDEEGLLRWRRDNQSGLWLNEPVVDPASAGRKRTLLSGTVKRGSTKKTADS
ncbi:hypothetical protein M3Y99_00038800 [Aphelenchoides fujianensis]|nr:hypothetical protein M3Y99_00038800 [Aphelenchoides fujianensis]